MLDTINHWRKGVRLYIGFAVVLVTIEIWWWASASYSGSSLFATRLEEAYAWLSLSMLAVAVSIGPAHSIWPRLYGKKIMYDARRLIGVGAAWFASLHITIAYVALFKAANPLNLPKSYQQSFALGLLAMIILLAMAFTSFDRAFKDLGIWWFRVHRFVYMALLLALLHAFVVGVHATQWPVLIILTAAALFILGMHVYLAFIRAPRPTTWQLLAVGGAAVLLVTIFSFGYGQKLGYNPITREHQHSQL
jgi:DMSO/TMAO reductase YedYZ heme-binding membrane subunit